MCFVYAPHDPTARSYVWNSIITQSSSNGPCLVVGHFNLIGSFNDKVGGSPMNWHQIKEFHDFVASAGIIEIPFSDLKYTWTNKRSGEANIRERIDRDFGNIELCKLCHFHMLLHKPLIGSDHAPLIYSSHPQRSKKCPTFGFESLWTTHDECEALVTNDEIYRATKKLGSLKAPGEDGFSATLRKLGFGEVWCNWIQTRLMSYDLQFMVNGESVGVVKPQRGLRQGDPISPYLFIIVADVLSRQLTKAMEFGSYPGIKMARTCPVISHIFFADDSIFFCKASQAECESLVSILDAYSHASGQNVNFQKSSAFFSPNTPSGLQNDLCSFLQVKKMGPKDKYLGLPSVYGRNKRREVLIKSVIQAIPKLSEPKADGGFGFRDLEAFNIALLAKQAKRGSRPSWLWSSLLHGRDLLLQGVRWQVGNGNHISFWTQKWVPNNEEFYVCSPIGLFSNSSKVADFIQNGKWDIRKLYKHVSNTEADSFMKIPISQSGSPDKFVWHFESKGQYTVKSCYKQALLWRKTDI
ncbi:reverse transcriptase [Tanacetum coccineum]